MARCGICGTEFDERRFQVVLPGRTESFDRVDCALRRAAGAADAVYEPVERPEAAHAGVALATGTAAGRASQPEPVPVQPPAEEVVTALGVWTPRRVTLPAVLVVFWVAAVGVSAAIVWLGDGEAPERVARRPAAQPAASPALREEPRAASAASAFPVVREPEGQAGDAQTRPQEARKPDEGQRDEQQRDERQRDERQTDADALVARPSAENPPAAAAAPPPPAPPAPPPSAPPPPPALQPPPPPPPPALQPPPPPPPPVLQPPPPPPPTPPPPAAVAPPPPPPPPAPSQAGPGGDDAGDEKQKKEKKPKKPKKDKKPKKEKR